MDNFIVPPIEEEKALPTEKEASERAFYAAATTDENPVEKFYTAKMDLETTGTSEFVDTAEKRWKEEQDVSTRDAVEGIIADPTIDRGIKLGVLQQYSLSGYVPKSLKDRYIDKTAATEVEGSTPTQREQQDWVVANLQNRRAQMNVETRERDIRENRSQLQSFLGGVEHLYSAAGNTLGLVSDEEYNIAHKEYKKHREVNPITTGIGTAVGLIAGAIPAAIPGALTGIVGASAATAALAGGALAGTSRFAELGQDGVDVDSRVNAALVEAGMTTVDFALPIFKAAGLLKAVIANGGAAVAINELSIGAQNTILEAYPELKNEQIDPTNMTVAAVFGGLVGAVFGRRANLHVDENGSMHGTKVPAGSPADATATANPKIAADLGITALKDPDSALVGAMGTNKGQIASDWAMPKVLDSDIEKLHPNMSRQLDQIDEEMREAFEDYRYDPNVINATKRDEDNAAIYEVLREIQGAKYQPANSTFIPSTNAQEGRMVFGPNEDGFFTKKADALKAATKLAETIKNTIPEDARGELKVIGRGKKGPYKVEWNFRKDYPLGDNAIQTFGPDSIQTSVSFLGKFKLDMSDLARSSAGRAFFPTGRLPEAVERGAIRAVERGARLERVFVKLFDKHIAGTKQNQELNILINDAEELGVDAFSKAEMSAKFPNLKASEIDNLFETHTYWRRMNHYFHSFSNRETRNKLMNDKMSGVYTNEGQYIGAMSKEIPAQDLSKIKEVWDLDTGSSVAYKADDPTIQSKTLVKVADTIQNGTDRYRYALVGKSHKIDMLPAEVLPRIPGYSPRITKERFFVDIIPNRLKVDGESISDPKSLREFSQTIAAARTADDGEKIKASIMDRYPDHTINVRPERRDTYGSVISGMEVHTQIFKQAKKRGERLPSLDGPARIEDRLVSAIKMAKSLSHMGAWGQWEQNFIDSFKKSFPQFLDKGEFPQKATDIIPLKNMGKEEAKSFKTAHRLWEYYANQKNYETYGDHLWKKNLHNVADILEKWKIPAGIIRDIADKENLLVRIPKQLSTMMYIHGAPIRQWLVQPAQLAEMHLISPETFGKSMNDLLLTRMYLSSVVKGEVQEAMESTVVKYIQKTGGDSKDFLDTIKAIQKSGMIEGIDMNVLVHGFFKEVDRNLVENTFEKISKDAASLAKSPIRLARTYGFDAAELTNRIGLFLQTKQMWLKKNPGKNWNTKENIEEIAYEATRLSGTMNRAGNLPYQEGAASVLFQFAAISHKLTMNLLQDNATMLTPGQRARLAVARMGLYGLEAGAIGGGIAYYLIDQSSDPVLIENAEMVRTGLMDYISNNFIASIVDPDVPSDMAVTKGMSPYSERFLPYFDVAAEMMKLFDDRPSTNPRFASLGMAGTFVKTVRDMQGWFMGREVTPENFKMVALEAAELAAGMSHISQGYVMLGLQEKVTANGNSIGMQYSKAEAIGKMLFGINSLKDQQLYEPLIIFGDHEANKKQVAKDIHQVLINMELKIGPRTELETANQINSFVSVLPESQMSRQDKEDIVAETMRLDKSRYTTVNESFFTKLLKRNQDDQTESDIKALSRIKRSKDPKTQDLIKRWENGEL